MGRTHVRLILAFGNNCLKRRMRVRLTDDKYRVGFAVDKGMRPGGENCPVIKFEPDFVPSARNDIIPAFPWVFETISDFFFIDHNNIERRHIRSGMDKFDKALRAGRLLRIVDSEELEFPRITDQTIGHAVDRRQKQLFGKNGHLRLIGQICGKLMLPGNDIGKVGEISVFQILLGVMPVQANMYVRRIGSQVGKS